MNRMRYEEILARLESVLSFCRDLGLDDELPTSRFMKYRACLENLIELVRRRDAGQTTTLPEEDQPLFLTALVESHELGEISGYLTTFDADTLGHKLRDVLRGPPLPVEEDPPSNHARNIMFELSLAAKLARIGLNVHLAEHPDLWIEINGKKLLIECKRPFLRRAVKDRISDARGQLDRQFQREPPGTRGLIALSLSKAMNRGDRVLSPPNETEGRMALAAYLSSLVDESRSRWKTLQGKKILGMLFHVITPALDQIANRYVVAQQIEMHTWPRYGGADDHSINVLGTAVKKLDNS